MRFTFVSAIICAVTLTLSSPSKSNLVPPTTSVESGKKTRQIEDIARSITIRIFSIGTENMGSGVLVKRTLASSGYEYIVLTNAHVLGSEYEKSCTNFPANSRFKIETPDGKIHGAILHPQSKELCKNKIDLAILLFNSNITPVYEIATIGSSINTKVGEEIYMAGFPCSIDACNKIDPIFISPGVLNKLSEPLISGYQIGYRINTQPGTSGGSVLNNKGQLIGIHGRGTNSQYSVVPSEEFKFSNGRNSSKEEENIISSNSWAIPSEQFINIINQLKNASKNENKSTDTSKISLDLLEANNTKIQAIERNLNKYQARDSQEKEYRDFILSFVAIIVSINTVIVIFLISKNNNKCN
jgi:S1-C subfamily serine protease